jgi:hypothetical protein
MTARSISLVRSFLASEITWFCVYVIIALIATGICAGRQCNNFIIFRSAFDHLLAGRDLYAAYPAEHADLYKYSPTFALLFAPFALLPFGIALLAWNLLNVLLPYVAIRLALPPGQRLEAIQLTGLGLIATVDGTQSNGLVAALIVLAFAALERNRIGAASAAIAMGVLVKLFPAAAGLLGLPRRDRIRFMALGICVTGAMVALPALVIGPSGLADQYASWFGMASVDAADRGGSVMRLLHIGAGYDGPNWPVQLIGIGLLALPVLLRPSRWQDADFRRGSLASVLLFSVIFNHKAEQPTFIIAVIGVAIWYALSPRGGVRAVLAGSTIAATVPILMTVISPGLVAQTVDGPLLIVSACCAVVWLTLQGELLDLFPERATESKPEFAGVSDEPAV